LTIILVHSISYVRPVTPEKKKQVKTNASILPAELGKIFSLVMSRFYCFEGGKANNNRIPNILYYRVLWPVQ